MPASFRLIMPDRLYARLVLEAEARGIYVGAYINEILEQRNNPVERIDRITELQKDDYWQESKDRWLKAYKNGTISEQGWKNLTAYLNCTMKEVQELIKRENKT